MLSSLEAVGFFRWPLLLSFVLVVALGLWSAFKLFHPRASPDPKTRIWVDATLFWGLFALIMGALGSLMGVVRVFQGLEATGQFLSAPVGRGLVMATVTPILGVTVLAVAALLWFFLQMRWRLLRADSG